MLMIIFGAGCLLLSVLFHAASLLHLGLPLLYALIVPTLFSGWYYSHYALANGIWYALIVLGLISWGVSLVRKGWRFSHPSPIGSRMIRSDILMEPTSTSIWNTSSPM